jgi:hypothetical protein
MSDLLISTVVSGQGQNRKVKRQLTAKTEDKLKEAAELFTDLYAALADEEAETAKEASDAAIKLLKMFEPAKRKTKAA